MSLFDLQLEYHSYNVLGKPSTTLALHAVSNTERQPLKP